MNERKLTMIDFQELSSYVEDRAKDFDKSGKGGKSEYIRVLVRRDRDEQNGQEQKLGKQYSRVIERIKQLDESRLEILDSFLDLMDEIKSQKKRARKPKKGTQD